MWSVFWILSSCFTHFSQYYNSSQFTVVQYTLHSSHYHHTIQYFFDGFYFCCLKRWKIKKVKESHEIGLNKSQKWLKEIKMGMSSYLSGLSLELIFIQKCPITLQFNYCFCDFLFLVAKKYIYRYTYIINLLFFIIN